MNISLFTALTVLLELVSGGWGLGIFHIKQEVLTVEIKYAIHFFLLMFISMFNSLITEKFPDFKF